MVEHLRSQASLAVEKERDTEEFFQEQAKKRPFVEMGMDDVGTESARRAKRREKEEDVEIGLVPGGTGRQFTVPGDVRDAARWGYPPCRAPGDR